MHEAQRQIFCTFISNVYTICINSQIKIFICHSTNCNMTESTQQIMDKHKLFSLDVKQHTKYQSRTKNENMNKKNVYAANGWWWWWFDIDACFISSYMHPSRAQSSKSQRYSNSYHAQIVSKFFFLHFSGEKKWNRLQLKW